MPRSSSRQMDMLVSWTELPRTALADHAFYDKLQAVLVASDFDGFVVERVCASSMRRGAVIADPEDSMRKLIAIVRERIPKAFGLGSDPGYPGALPDEQGQPGSAALNSNCRRR